jgi:hypothetical protein
MPGISCTAQAYGWADLSSDHIFLYNREEDTCVIAPDPLSGWQKILIGVPGPFRAISEKNTVPFDEWVETIHEENTSHYFHCLRQLSLYTGNVAVQNMLSRLGGHEAQGISLPLSEGHHHYLLTYVHPRALSPFLDFCERNCKTVFGSGYAIRVIDGLKD